MQTSKYREYYDDTVAKCKKCTSLPGFIPVGTAYRDCECFTQYKWLKQLHDSGLPKLYWKQALTDFTGDADALAIVGTYIKNLQDNLKNGDGLLLYGQPGVGKTLLASFILKAGLKLGKQCNFYYFNSVLTTFTEAWKDKAAQEEVERNIINSDLLVLDDLGREYKSNAKLHEAILDSVIRQRASNMKPVILTSNLDKYDIKEAYGANVIDLFKGSLKSVEVTGESYRGEHGPA